MRRRFVVLQCAVLLSSLLPAQQADSKKTKSNVAKPVPAAIAKTDARGMRMLQAAAAEAGTLDSGIAAFALMQVARGYATTDKLKAMQLLEEALAATRPIENEAFAEMGQRAQLQSYIMRELVNLAPVRADELLLQIEPEARESVLLSLLAYYEGHNQLNRAIDALYRISAEKEMPYEIALRLMSALPPESDSERLQIFTTALASYRDHTAHEHVGDFSALIVTFKDKLPAPTIREAIDTVFHQAEQDLKSGEKPPVVAMSTRKGSVTFQSPYEFRLFQLLPILHDLDESATEQLLKQHPEVAAALERYPFGVASLGMSDDTEGSKRRAENGTGAAWKIRADRTNVATRMAEFSKAWKLVGEADLHPSDALANIDTITDYTVRCYALDGIARASLRKDPAVARSATRKLVDSIDSAEGLDIQLMLLRTAVDLFLRLDDHDNARAVLGRGFALAEKAYKLDSNADEPNRVIKAFWPSTAAYRWFCGQAAQLEPDWALGITAKIPDAELRVVAEIALAQTWLKVPPGPTPVITANKPKPDTLMVE